MPHVLGHVEESNGTYESFVGLLHPAYVAGKTKKEGEEIKELTNGVKVVVKTTFPIIFFSAEEELVHGQIVRFHPEIIGHYKDKAFVIATNVVGYQIHDEADEVEKSQTFHSLVNTKKFRIKSIWKGDWEYKNSKSFREIYVENGIINDRPPADEQVYNWLVENAVPFNKMNLLRKPQAGILGKISAKLTPEENAALGIE